MLSASPGPRSRTRIRGCLVASKLTIGGVRLPRRQEIDIGARLVARLPAAESFADSGVCCYDVQIVLSADYFTDRSSLATLRAGADPDPFTGSLPIRSVHFRAFRQDVRKVQEEARALLRKQAGERAGSGAFSQSRFRHRALQPGGRTRARCRSPSTHRQRILGLGVGPLWIQRSRRQGAWGD